MKKSDEKGGPACACKAPKMPGWFVCFECFVRALLLWLPREHWGIDGVHVRVVEGDAFVFAKGPVRKAAALVAASVLDADRKGDFSKVGVFVGEYARALGKSGDAFLDALMPAPRVVKSEQIEGAGAAGDDDEAPASFVRRKGETAPACGSPFDELGVRCELMQVHEFSHVEHRGMGVDGEEVEWSDENVRAWRREDGVPDGFCGAPHASGCRCRLEPSVCRSRNYEHVDADETSRALLRWRDAEGELFEGPNSIPWTRDMFSVRYETNGTVRTWRNDASKAEGKGVEQSEQTEAENAAPGDNALPTTLSLSKRTIYPSDRNDSQKKTEDLNGCEDGASDENVELRFLRLASFFKCQKSNKSLVQCVVQWVVLHPCANSAPLGMLCEMWGAVRGSGVWESRWTREEVEGRVRWIVEALMVERRAMKVGLSNWLRACQIAVAGSVAEIMLHELTGTWEFRGAEDLHASDAAYRDVVRSLWRAALAARNPEVLAVEPERVSSDDETVSSAYLNDREHFLWELKGFALGRLTADRGKVRR